MASFADALRSEGTHKYTENGAQALNTTGNACIDLFGSIGSLRTREESDVCRLFGEAYKEDPLIATKIAFYARDIREGLGERETFRSIIRYLAIYHPNALINNIPLIGIYGRYDDLYALINTPLETAMWTDMAIQFEEDRHNMEDGKAISLLAKWIKTPDASSPKTRALGILTAQKLGYSVYRFKRILRAMRKYLKVVEGYMSTNQWDKIEYPEVPSRAMMIYRNAFMKHDPDRFSEFTTKAVSGEVKVNSSTLYPYDIVEKMWNGYGRIRTEDPLLEDPLLEAQWRQLPNYVEPGTNALVIADTSGSMCGRPMATSIGLAIYFAERNVGAYQNLFIPFSSSACVHRITGETLVQKITSLHQSDDFGFCGSTNMEKAFQVVLDIAVRNNVPKSEMVKSLIIISDMEIDCACNTNQDANNWRSHDTHWAFYDNMRARYEAAGYDMPNVIFWNVDSRHDTFHADADKKGVQLVSGQSTTVFKQVMDSIGLTPVEMMMKVINSDRYSSITIG